MPTENAKQLKHIVLHQIFTLCSTVRILIHYFSLSQSKIFFILFCLHNLFPCTILLYQRLVHEQLVYMWLMLTRGVMVPVRFWQQNYIPGENCFFFHALVNFEILLPKHQDQWKENIQMHI